MTLMFLVVWLVFVVGFGILVTELSLKVVDSQGEK